MKILINLFGPRVKLKQPFLLDLDSGTLRDVLLSIKKNSSHPCNKILKDDFSLKDGWTILVNGRNIFSLKGLDTQIKDGDEITFTVLLSGG